MEMVVLECINFYKVWSVVISMFKKLAILLRKDLERRKKDLEEEIITTNDKVREKSEEFFLKYENVPDSVVRDFEDKLGLIYLDAIEKKSKILYKKEVRISRLEEKYC